MWLGQFLILNTRWHRHSILQDDIWQGWVLGTRYILIKHVLSYLVQGLGGQGQDERRFSETLSYLPLIQPTPSRRWCFWRKNEEDDGEYIIALIVLLAAEDEYTIALIVLLTVAQLLLSHVYSLVAVGSSGQSHPLLSIIFMIKPIPPLSVLEVHSNPFIIFFMIEPIPPLLFLEVHSNSFIIFFMIKPIPPLLVLEVHFIKKVYEQIQSGQFSLQSDCLCNACLCLPTFWLPDLRCCLQRR